ncbi:hypothetical protein [Rhizobium rhizogenes]|uniref:Uncharacterized protein n=1 Tax=Rhizobium rhizogenes TaxID=359 RepID=A0AA92C6N8_RHIRH|nr:hypothetical protein [Rhizobium rhizogenes]PVE56999.1 hypothetical protein DC430_04415 [Rhizobium rhizogenes]PVE68490.1 hypothetical protein DC415_01805 [Agrobacterium tumefaciens]PVE78238.1 hypothetical protein DCP16_01805 [Sphingomonas sp. TPD3009]
MVKEDKTAEFMIAEYQNARARINSDIDEINKSEVFYITVWGLLYFAIFQFKITDHGFLKGVILLPVVISLYSLLRYHAHRFTIKTYEAYIKQWVEPYFLQYGVDPSGLSTFYDSYPGRILKPVRFVFHFALLAFSVLFAAMAWCYPEYAASIIAKGAEG